MKIRTVENVGRAQDGTGLTGARWWGLGRHLPQPPSPLHPRFPSLLPRYPGEAASVPVSEGEAAPAGGGKGPLSKWVGMGVRRSWQVCVGVCGPLRDTGAPRGRSGKSPLSNTSVTWFSMLNGSERNKWLLGLLSFFKVINQSTHQFISLSSTHISRHTPADTLTQTHTITGAHTRSPGVNFFSSSLVVCTGTPRGRQKINQR